ncbi:GNAT family N-acetyltransferase [Vagococcus sp. BWB3-3]|uniref:GNAT family N-acetyltransferase n=1 Tax=Vagococcus allomyrinae TaxID=2794353 RepID=A0A940PFD0_9ENTE|nr:GNAT family N-acetyltransferase [Vagococcus allomyrinae]MBP1043854.1 GNAT family N-acetyltransferase [Vagococcus allomyrinae]
MITYREIKEIESEQLMDLYQSVGWVSYTANFARLKKGVANSLKVVTAWQEDRLVGLIRVVGDGQTIVYIQDILVNPTFHGKGIGSELMKRILAEYQEVRQTVLMTEEAPDIRHFYEKHGFNSCDQGQAVSFAIFK